MLHPPTRIEEDYRPTVDRILDAVDRVMGFEELSEEIFLLPDVGEGLTEAEIVTWKVAVGDVVTLNQPLVDIETAKATVELPSPYAGTVVALHGTAPVTCSRSTSRSSRSKSVAARAPHPPPPSRPPPRVEASFLRKAPSDKTEGSVGRRSRGRPHWLRRR